MQHLFLEAGAEKWGDSWSCAGRRSRRCRVSLSSQPGLQTWYSICSAHAWMCSVVLTLVSKGRSLCLQHLSVSTCDWPVSWSITATPLQRRVPAAAVTILLLVYVRTQECPKLRPIYKTLPHFPDDMLTQLFLPLPAGTHSGITHTSHSFTAPKQFISQHKQQNPVTAFNILVFASPVWQKDFTTVSVYILCCSVFCPIRSVCWDIMQPPKNCFHPESKTTWDWKGCDIWGTWTKTNMHVCGKRGRHTGLCNFQGVVICAFSKLV